MELLYVLIITSLVLNFALLITLAHFYRKSLKKHKQERLKWEEEKRYYVKRNKELYDKGNKDFTMKGDK